MPPQSPSAVSCHHSHHQSCCKSPLYCNPFLKILLTFDAVFWPVWCTVVLTGRLAVGAQVSKEAVWAHVHPYSFRANKLTVYIYIYIYAVLYSTCVCVCGVSAFMSSSHKGIVSKEKLVWAQQSNWAQSQNGLRDTTHTWLCAGQCTVAYILLSSWIQRVGWRGLWGGGTWCTEWVWRSGWVDTHRVAHQTRCRPEEFRGGMCNRIIQHTSRIQQFSMQERASRWKPARTTQSCAKLFRTGSGFFFFLLLFRGGLSVRLLKYWATLEQQLDEQKPAVYIVLLWLHEIPL